MAMKPRASTRSGNRKTTGKVPKEGAGRGQRAARAHRGDTPEGTEQRRRIAKTHPTRNASAGRKDSAAKNRRGSER